jgi:hypothetical protein
MRGIDDSHSILWRYLPDIFVTSYTYIYETTDDHDDLGIQTRIVFRVLLRVGQSIFKAHLLTWGLNYTYLLINVPAHWHQTYFRPNKPLPTNVGSNHSRPPRQAFKWVIVDFFVSCLFLGVPYLFYERTRLSSWIDEESGLRYATPTLVVGACTCLVVRLIHPLLTWAWTGKMFFSTHFAPFAQIFTIFFSIERLLPTPFTQEELMTLTRSFGGTYQTSLFNNK